ncbi:Photosystem I reaction center subunit III [cf. Phormidesmis sp. LEGE 11477]|uniref:Photosystem I reaction center subunit III n=1 Tax=cf. Phormidesmis sp. LEGE 11477 TaxID=1828680 RepID=UPI001880DB76|nr:Photosystem I reaction center subunit III [cf. Phormidesmis sp. LEGE 11477]MBE9061595.1 Photosystem I reaction center subunit III [cf. Phormidesmis sp. LEGE 11477]
MHKTMHKFFSLLLAAFVWLNVASPAAAASEAYAGTHLVPCASSPAFNERMQNAPDGYYFDTPYQSYAANLLCGAEGLPHQQLRFDRAIDVLIPFGIFFYVAGFIGWSGRAYLISSNRNAKPEETEIFIDVALAIKSFVQGLLWPLLALKELTTGELTAPVSEVSVSPR